MTTKYKCAYNKMNAILAQLILTCTHTMVCQQGTYKLKPQRFKQKYISYV